MFEVKPGVAAIQMPGQRVQFHPRRGVVGIGVDQFIYQPLPLLEGGGNHMRFLQQGGCHLDQRPLELELRHAPVPECRAAQDGSLFRTFAIALHEGLGGFR